MCFGSSAAYERRRRSRSLSGENTTSDRTANAGLESTRTRAHQQCSKDRSADGAPEHSEEVPTSRQCAVQSVTARPSLLEDKRQQERGTNLAVTAAMCFLSEEFCTIAASKMLEEQ